MTLTPVIVSEWKLTLNPYNFDAIWLITKWNSTFLFLNISNQTLFLVVEFLSTFILHVLLAIQDISKCEVTSTCQMEIQLCGF